jgi:hypothetical protein
MRGIAVGSSTQVYGLDNMGAPVIWAPPNGWQPLAGELQVHIPSGSPLWGGEDLTGVPSSCLDIDIASDGTLCVLMPQLSAYQAIALRWDQPTGTWRSLRRLGPRDWDVAQIAVGSATLIYGITWPDRNAVRLCITGTQADAPDGDWQPLPDLLNENQQVQHPISITAGSDGSVWVVGEDGNIYALKADGSGWQLTRKSPVTPDGTRLTAFRIAGADDHVVALANGLRDSNGNGTTDILVMGPRSPTFVPPLRASAASFDSPARAVTGPSSDAPAIAAYQRKLYCAYPANDRALAVRGDTVANWSANGNQSGARQPDIFLGSAPALAVMAGGLYGVFRANDPRNIPYVTRTYDGDIWWPGLGLANIPLRFPDGSTHDRGLKIPMSGAPALVEFGGRLYCAFQGSGNQMVVLGSSDGNSWTMFTLDAPSIGLPAVIGVDGILMGSAPALAVFNGTLYCAFQADNATHTLHVTSSADGDSWVSPAKPITGIKIGSAPALTAFKNRLYCAYRADDQTHALCVTSSVDGENWDLPQRYEGISIGSAPALCALDRQLYVAFQSNTDNSIFLTVTPR